MHPTHAVEIWATKKNKGCEWRKVELYIRKDGDYDFYEYETYWDEDDYTDPGTRLELRMRFDRRLKTVKIGMLTGYAMLWSYNLNYRNFEQLPPPPPPPPPVPAKPYNRPFPLPEPLEGDMWFIGERTANLMNRRTNTNLITDGLSH